MSVPFLLEVVAIVLAAIAQIQAKGQSLVAWAVILVCIALLWGRIT